MHSSRKLIVIAIALLTAMVGAACSSQASIEPSASVSDSSESTNQTADAPSEDQTQSAPDTGNSPDSGADVAVALDTAPLDYAVISAGPSVIQTTPLPCQISGPVVAAFAESRDVALGVVSGNQCRWSNGRSNVVQIVYKDVTTIDAQAERGFHGADDTVIDESGPGTDAASYLDDDGLTERYFFIQDGRAVFIVAETQLTPTAQELRAMADEIAGLVGAAVNDERYWSDAGESGEEPLCSVWDENALRQMFGATDIFPGGSGGGCNWWMDGPDNVSHQVTIDLDPFDSIETYTRNGGSSVDIGDRAAAISEPGLLGPIRKVAFVVGDRAMTITVDSATHSELADVLALNVAARLG